MGGLEDEGGEEEAIWWDTPHARHRDLDFYLEEVGDNEA